MKKSQLEKIRIALFNAKSDMDTEKVYSYIASKGKIAELQFWQYLNDYNSHSGIVSKWYK